MLLLLEEAEFSKAEFILELKNSYILGMRR